MEKEDLRPKPEHLLEIIKDEWADIHHTRNQEWTSLAIIGGIIYILFQAENLCLQQAIAGLGIIVCILSILMSFRHWLLFKTRIKIILLLQEEVGIRYKFHEYALKIPVQSIIFTFYSLLTSALTGYLVYLFWSRVWLAIFIFFYIFILGISLCLLAHEWISEKVAENVWIALREKTGENWKKKSEKSELKFIE